jgi:glyoxylase-like metal-dependent hydrolase (beta-lactamase superfamily II)
MLEVARFINSRFNSNTFILSLPKYDDVWVVDPGDTEPLFEWMRNHQKNCITGILLTHAHFDHIYGMNEIVSRYPSCIVYIANEYGLDALHNPKKNGSKYTEEGPIEIVEHAKVEYYRDTMQLWDGVTMRTINTPGHSDDSQCLLVDGMLFTGDALIKDVRTVTKLKGGSVEKLDESMKIIASLKGNSLRVMPGHGDEFELDEYDLSKMNDNPLNKERICQQK